MSLTRWWVLGRKDYSSPLCCVIKLSGVLQAPQRGAPGGGFRGRLINIERVQKWIDRAFFKNLQPAAVAIVVNSPGGAPTQAELIHRAIVKKSTESNIPVYTFAEDVAASGGMWLLCAGKEIYACETSIVGSIGVISSSFGAVDALGKLGLERRIFTAGESKLGVDPFLPVSPEQEKRLRYVMNDLHNTFIQVVKDSRGEKIKLAVDEKSSSSSAKDVDIFDGRVFTGKQALQLGLIDGIGSVDTVMKEKLGEKTRFLLCSEAPQPGLRDILGASTSSFISPSSSPSSVFRLWSKIRNNVALGSAMDSANSETLYEEYRAMAQAMLDEAEQRALWAKHTVH